MRLAPTTEFPTRTFGAAGEKKYDWDAITRVLDTGSVVVLEYGEDFTCRPAAFQAQVSSYYNSSAAQRKGRKKVVTRKRGSAVYVVYKENI